MSWTTSSGMMTVSQCSHTGRSTASGVSQVCEVSLSTAPEYPGPSITPATRQPNAGSGLAR